MGIRETLKVMRALLLKAKREDTRVRDCASDIIRYVVPKNWRGEICAIFSFVRDTTRYQKDIVDIETLQTPWETRIRGYGDCDDQALLTAALLECVGHPTRFMAVGFTPNSLVHVYTQAKSGNEWISLDTTEPHYMGWEPPGITNRLIIYNGN